MTARKDGPSAACKLRVMKRDKFTCVYCGKNGSEVELEIDHIIPVAKGGSNHMSNLQTMCAWCNRSKGKGDRPVTTQDIVAGDVNEKPLSLVGMFVHRMEDGNVQNQGRIISEGIDSIMVQRYSFLDGSETDIVLWNKSEDLKFYMTDKSMRMAYAKMEGWDQQSIDAQERFWEVMS
jgi:hypothetical protein